MIWSLLYSAVDLLRNVQSGNKVHWLGFIYRFIVGKSATPFYYIVVLMQLTVITPWLVNVVKRNGILSWILWLITPIYLIYVYAWNYIVGIPPRLYETLFPAWFGFYYLGIQVRCGRRIKCSGYIVTVAFFLSCVEALGLKMLGLDISFYTSQITAGSFLYSITVIGWILKKIEKGGKTNCLLSKIGDCSYGIFYIHMAVLKLVGGCIAYNNWYAYWGLRVVLTSFISFVVVCTVQNLLKHNRKILRYIGFV